MSELAAVEETAVWLEVNGRPAVTWMCTPELLEELAVGWLHGEGYIDRVEEVQLRPCATDLATFPFVRQFAAVEPAWFDGQAWPALHAWLRHWLESGLFSACMAKLPPQQAVAFPPLA